MVEIKKIVREVEEIKPIEPKVSIDFTAYHKELEKITPKFIGLIGNKEEIQQIITETTITLSEEQQLQNRFHELMDDKDFGIKQPKKSLREEIEDLKTQIQKLSK